jgi:hypothetical protein
MEVSTEWGPIIVDDAASVGRFELTDTAHFNCNKCLVAGCTFVQVAVALANALNLQDEGSHTTPLPCHADLQSLPWRTPSASKTIASIWMGTLIRPLTFHELG